MGLITTALSRFASFAPFRGFRGPNALSVARPVDDSGHHWGGLIPAVVDPPFWPRGGPADRTWSDLAQDMDDALEAWRKNFLIRQIVRLTTAYVVGDGITVKARNQLTTRFAADFWSHRQNRLDRRLSAWCDELTRSGELFIALFTNPLDGMSYVRAIPARQIVAVETSADDYETETGYLEQADYPTANGQAGAGWGEGGLPPFTRRWLAPAYAPPDAPCLLHYVINRPVGATRGESDLTPILPWALRYTTWLKDRVRFNAIRTEMAAAWIKVADETAVSRKRLEYEANPPTGGNIFVTGPGEELTFPTASIDAGDASPDGLALRLAVAAGADIPLHFLAEGSSATRSTAEEMGDPTRRHYRMRQLDFGNMLCDLAEQAYRRRCTILGIRRAADTQLYADMPDVSREDNQALATSAKIIVETFAIMRANGWIDDTTAITLAFKFAGEILTDDQIDAILATAPPVGAGPRACPQEPPQ
jgi:hypothetical protein